MIELRYFIIISIIISLINILETEYITDEVGKEDRMYFTKTQYWPGILCDLNLL